MNWYVNLNGQTKLEIDGLTDRRAALFKGNIAGAADLKDLVVAHQIDEFIVFSFFRKSGAFSAIHAKSVENNVQNPQFCHSQNKKGMIK